MHIGIEYLEDVSFLVLVLVSTQVYLYLARWGRHSRLPHQTIKMLALIVPLNTRKGLSKKATIKDAPRIGDTITAWQTAFHTHTHIHACMPALHLIIIQWRTGMDG